MRDALPLSFPPFLALCTQATATLMRKPLSRFCAAGVIRARPQERKDCSRPISRSKVFGLANGTKSSARGILGRAKKE